MKRICVMVGLLSVAAISSASFDGPAPVAWRWVQPVVAVPSGKPVIDGDVLYIPNGQYIYALDRNTGNQKWRFPNSAPENFIFRYSPMVTGDLVICKSENRMMVALDKKTGRPVWRYLASEDLRNESVIAGKYIVQNASGNGLLAINVADGQEVWSTPMRFAGGIRGPIRAFNNDIIFFSGDGNLNSVNTINRRNNWQLPFAFIDQNSEPIVNGDTVYINSGSYITAVSAATGLGLWQYNAGEHLRFSPVVARTSVASVSDNGKVYFLGLNGGPFGKGGADFGVAPMSQPAAIGDNILVSGNNGALNLIDPSTGDNIWSYQAPPLDPELKNAKGQKVVGIPAAGPGVSVGDALYIRLVDGSLISFDKTQGVDLTPPNVKMLWPNPGEEVSGHAPLGIYFRISDDGCGVNNFTLKVDIDGKPIPFKLSREGTISIIISKVGRLTTLENGRHMFNISVADWLGNLATKSFPLIVNNTLPPLGFAPASAVPAGTNPATGASAVGAPGSGTGGGGGGSSSNN